MLIYLKGSQTSIQTIQLYDMTTNSSKYFSSFFLQGSIAPHFLTESKLRIFQQMSYFDVDFNQANNVNAKANYPFSYNYSFSSNNPSIIAANCDIVDSNNKCIKCSSNSFYRDP
jgi:hypothetical protein